jgi:outer membrane biosynthesis protein TonB
MRRMDDPDRLEAKGLARAKIRAKRRRTYSIRRRTIRGSLALFAIVWSIVFLQLVSGNDPALSRTPKAHRRAVAAKPQPAPEPETETEAEAEAALEAERLPEEEFVEEPEVEEPEVAPEEAEPVETEVAPEPAPEPEPIVTSAS